MNYTFVIISSFAAFILWPLAAIVLALRPKEQLNRLFFGYASFASAYCFFNAIKLLSDMPETLIFERVQNTAWVLFLGTLLLFCLNLAKVKSKIISRSLLFLFSISSLVILVLNWFTEAIYRAPVPSYWGSLSPNGEFFRVFAVYSSLSIVVQLLLLFLSFINEEEGRRRKQKLLLLSGLLISFVVGTTFDVVLPMLGFFIPTSIPITIAIYIAFFAYAMVRYGFLSISPADLTMQLFHLIPDYVIFLDNDNRIAFSNPKFEVATGYKSNEMIGHPVDEYFVDYSAQKLAAGKNDMTLRRKAGDPFFVKISGQEVLDNFGDRLGRVLVLSDVTNEELLIKQQQKMIDELNQNKSRMLSILDDTTQARNDARKKSDEINQLYEQLKEVDRMKTEFLSVISHELRTPITPIRGYLEILSSGQMGELSLEQKKVVELLLKETVHLQSLIESILDVSRLEKGGKITLLKEPVSLSTILNDLRDIMRPDFETREISFTVNLPDDFPVIIADDRKLRQLFTNIVGNSLKFTPRGGWIKISGEKSSNTVTLYFDDNGIGIAKENVGKIFEKFYQVDSSITRAAGGAGLGLAIAREIVDAHGGSISAESPGLGLGARFKVVLPID